MSCVGFFLSFGSVFWISSWRDESGLAADSLPSDRPFYRLSLAILLFLFVVVVVVVVVVVAVVVVPKDHRRLIASFVFFLHWNLKGFTE